jgi:hypothetical protein
MQSKSCMLADFVQLANTDHPLAVSTPHLAPHARLESSKTSRVKIQCMIASIARRESSRQAAQELQLAISAP